MIKSVICCVKNQNTWKRHCYLLLGLLLGYFLFLFGHILFLYFASKIRNTLKILKTLFIICTDHVYWPHRPHGPHSWINEVAGCKPEMYKVAEWDMEQVYILIIDTSWHWSQVGPGHSLSSWPISALCVLSAANHMCLWSPEYPPLYSWSAR